MKAPDENYDPLGSGCGGAPVSLLFWRCRLGVHGSSGTASSLRDVSVMVNSDNFKQGSKYILLLNPLRKTQF